MEQFTENSFLQYFIGFSGYQEAFPFDVSTLVLFRRRICAEMLMEVNEYLLSHRDDDNNNNTHPSAGSPGNKDTGEDHINKKTLTLDATCALADMRYSQNVLLLNEAREKLETIIYRCFYKFYGLLLPRRYGRRARKDYLAFAKSRKHSKKKIRKALRTQLGYVARDIRYLE